MHRMTLEISRRRTTAPKQAHATKRACLMTRPIEADFLAGDLELYDVRHAVTFLSWVEERWDDRIPTLLEVLHHEMRPR